MPEWHQLVPMSGLVRELETAKKLQLYATSTFQVHSFVCQLDYIVRYANSPDCSTENVRSGLDKKVNGFVSAAGAACSCFYSFFRSTKPFREEMICDGYKYIYESDCGRVVSLFLFYTLSCLSTFAPDSIPVQETQFPDLKSYQNGLSSLTNGSEANNHSPQTREYKR